MKRIIFAFFILLIVGCGPEIINLKDTIYPPTQSVELLTKYPAKLYIEIAIMTITDEDYFSTKHMMEDLKKSAMKIGADALVIHGTGKGTSVVAGTMVGTGLFFLPMSHTMVKATAIRYK